MKYEYKLSQAGEAVHKNISSYRLVEKITA